MAIIAGIAGLIGRFAGKLLTTALGWASTLLFGRVPQSKQVLLALMTFGSLIWIALVAGVIIPDVGTFLLAFVPVPDFVREEWVRLAMLIGAVVLPLGIGVIGLVLAEDRTISLDALKQVLRGYPLTAVIAVTIAFLALVALVRKARSLARGWSDAHIPIVVKPNGYERVVGDIEDVLDRVGLEVERRPANAALSMPGKLLAAVAGSGVDALVPERLLMLVGPELEVGLYPSDIAVSGGEKEVARARAAIATRLTATDAYLTTAKETQEIEDRLQRLAREGAVESAAGSLALAPEARAELAAVDELLASLVVPYDEWEVLYRMRLQVERDLLSGRRPGVAVPGADARVARPIRTRSLDLESEPQPAFGAAFGLGALLLVLLDVVLAIYDRIRPPGRPGNPR